MPEKNQRELILDKVLPKKSRNKDLSLSELDLDGLSGGDLKNVALNSAGIAMKNNSDKITKQHLEEAIKLVKFKQKTKENKEVDYIS